MNRIYNNPKVMGEKIFMCLNINIHLQPMLEMSQKIVVAQTIHSLKQKKT